MLPPIPPAAPGQHRPGQPRRRLIVVGLALVLAAAVVTGLLLRPGSHRQPSGSPSTVAGRPGLSSTASTSAASTESRGGTASASTAQASNTAQPSKTAQPGNPRPGNTAPLLGRGLEAPAAAIPWGQLTDGWDLRAWASTAPNVLAPATLYLVNPIGGRYRIATLPPNTAVALWSPDHRRTIVKTYADAGVSVAQLDLATGRRTGGFALGDRSLLGYAGPGATALLLSYPSVGAGPTNLERVSFTGRHQRSYPAVLSLTGRLTGGTAVYSTDGTRFLISGRHGFAVLADTGATLRQLPLPAGAATCTVLHRFDGSSAMAACSRGSTTNLFRVPLGAGKPAALSQATPPDYGFADGYPTAVGVLTERATSCGPGPLAVLDAAGTARPFPVRLPASIGAGRVALVGASGDRVLVLSNDCAAGPRSLVSVNLRTGVGTVLLGPGLNGGSVR